MACSLVVDLVWTERYCGADIISYRYAKLQEAKDYFADIWCQADRGSNGCCACKSTKVEGPKRSNYYARWRSRGDDRSDPTCSSKEQESDEGASGDTL